MRHIGSVEDEAQAKTLRAWLTTQNIRCMVEEEDGQWAVWIYEEDQVDAGRSALDEFRSSPADPKYAAAVRQADTIERDAEKTARKARRRQVNVREQWDRPLWQRTPVTMTLVLVSLVVCVATTTLDNQTGMGLMGPRLCNKASAAHLLISAKAADLPEVRSGQVWRLISPIFLHFNMLHILFNMIWTRDLGSAIELRRGSLKFAGIVAVCGLVSNLGQNYVTGPAFGGMSGVGFGLFGYIYIKSRYEPEAGLYMSSNLAMFGLLWLFLGFSGVIGGMANYAHLFGMVTGGVLAYLPVVFRGR